MDDNFSGANQKVKKTAYHGGMLLVARLDREFHKLNNLIYPNVPKKDITTIKLQVLGKLYNELSPFMPHLISSQHNEFYKNIFKYQVRLQNNKNDGSELELMFALNDWELKLRSFAHLRGLLIPDKDTSSGSDDV